MMLICNFQVFLFFAALMQRFKFEPVEDGQDQPMPSLEAASGGVTRSPRPFGVKVTRTDNHRALLNNNNTLKAKEFKEDYNNTLKAKED